MNLNNALRAYMQASPSFLNVIFFKTNHMYDIDVELLYMRQYKRRTKKINQI